MPTMNVSLESALSPNDKSPPMVPGALPFVGHSLDFLRDPLPLLIRAASTGRVAKMVFGQDEAVLLREPEDIEHVVVTSHRKFMRDKPTRALSQVLGDGLLTSDGDVWLRHRRLIAPSFHRERVNLYGRAMVEAAARFADERSPNEERNLHADMLGLTLGIVTRALFTSDRDERASEISSAINLLAERFGNLWFLLFPWLGRLPLPTHQRAEEALAMLDDVILGMVRERRERGGKGSDLLSTLLASQDDAGKGLSDREMRDELMTLFVAGHETTALALTFTFVLLARSSEAETRLREELRSVLGDAPATAEDFTRLPFTRAVVLEAMRIYPPAWGIGREAVEDVSIGGYRVGKGEQVWMSQWVNHRDVRYFPEPERFLPERWLGGMERSLPRFAYYPFGGGPRICIGNGFAMMELVLVLATLVRKNRVRIHQDKPLALSPRITLRPTKPIYVTYERVKP